jgi:hypothetical protein
VSRNWRIVEAMSARDTPSGAREPKPAHKMHAG